MGRCKLCGNSSKIVSDVLGVCIECLRKRPEEALPIAMKVHREYRKALGLPLEPPTSSTGVKCSLCINECSIPLNGTGFCGVWKNVDGVLKPVEGLYYGVAHYYLDPLPTNCVATPVCPAYTGAGYPRYALSQGTEYGYYNLAVFFAGCNLDCLFCQNWEHKNIIADTRIRIKYKVSENELFEAAMASRVSCICYFGGDPGPHTIYALKVSKRIIEEAEERGVIKRICWETNGLVNENIMREMAKLSFISGGIVKIDWKAWTPAVYQALTGVDGWRAVKQLMKNIKIVADIASDKREIPLLVVSILLVPGYVDEEEVYSIAEYIAFIDSNTPIVLLAFHPNHLLRDLPPTSKSHAKKSVEAAHKAGLRRVFIGNEWLLGDYY
jgi:pyruvate formate lyase activating enzyme|uniref:Radical SAM protein n=1 Tax=Ignisphaera aggregans TaxID=334771 RepID=A0A7J2U6M7_9CREN